MPEERSASSPYRALNVGYTLLAAIAVGWGIGWWIDDAAGTEPLWTVIMIAVFLVAGLYQIVKEYWPRDEEDASSAEPHEPVADDRPPEA
jgi:F0F1-type ATP synthase assembly protein I